MSYVRFDEKVARSLQDQLDCTGITENAVFPKEKGKENYRPRTLIDETLEYIDPTPNIYTLFVQFNEKFFWNTLLPVQVKWSPRMTSCAGICTFHPRNKECIVALSTPLLKLRPRKDLVETLLHEMIHAYLFLTNNNRDRDGHGPVFQSHMHRINKAAGTKITIYHTFHEEVKLYQQHWWRCSGVCQKRAPYFGMVRRAMNRAPGPNDLWWKEHQATCGGQFIKIKEPEKPEKKKIESKKRTSLVSKIPEKNSILDWIKKPGPNAASTQNKNNDTEQYVQIKSPKIISSNSKSNNFSNIQTDLKKLGNSTNNVYGWGTGGPNAASISNNQRKTNVDPNRLAKSDQSRLSFSGTLGGSGSGRSNLLDKYSNLSTSGQNTLVKTPTGKISLGNSFTTQEKTVNCPSCQKSVEETKINEHLDGCLTTSNELETIDITHSKKRKSDDDYSTSNKVYKNDTASSNKVYKNDTASSSSDIECPLCSKKVKVDIFNEHLDICASNDHIDLIEDQNVSLNDTSFNSVNLHDSPHVCLICDKVLEPNMTLNEHLEDCVSTVFNDSNDNDIVEEVETGEKEKVVEYPCPVCMTLVDESSMNAHLDTCLG